MRRIHVYLSEETSELLSRMAADQGVSVSQLIGRMTVEKAESKSVNLQKMQEDIRRITMAQHEQGKQLSVMMDAFNSYFRMFAVGENEKVFYPIDQEPHPWIRKAFEAVEARIRMAKYAQVKGEKSGIKTNE